MVNIDCIESLRSDITAGPSTGVGHRNGATMAPSTNVGEPYLEPAHPPTADNHQFPRSFTAGSGISLFLVLYKF